jgi:hypothetical protein
MKRLMKITLVVSALILLTDVAEVASGFRNLIPFEAAAQSAGEQAFGDHEKKVLTLDVAVDCRTIVSGLNRGDVFIINGKIFPPGTLPSGVASNDPTQPVNGAAPIGDFLGRGQHAFPFPLPVAPAYSSTPGDFATQYFMFDNGRTALTAEGYAFLRGQIPSEVLLSVTGGIARFRGAAGDIHGVILGTNVTGCPNSRARIDLVPGR